MAKTDESLKEQVEADFNPNETPRERLERLTAEAAVLRTEIAEKETAEAAAKMLPAIQELVKLLEQQNPGKVARKMTVRYVRPGAEMPKIVEKLEPKQPGVTVSFSVVTPRAPKSAEAE